MKPKSVLCAWSKDLTWTMNSTRIFLRFRTKTAWWRLLGITGTLMLALGKAWAIPPTLDELGYQTLRVNGELALGSRPLLVVLIDAEGSGLEYPPDHNLEYYRSNIFDVYEAQSVNGFLLENSNDRFSFSRTGHPGVIGPVALPADERYPPTLERAGGDVQLADLLFHSNLVARTMMSGLIDFTQLNTDANPDITGDELHLLFIFNEAGSGGAARSPGRVQPPGFDYALDVGSDAGVSFSTPFDTLTHELTHTLGGFDLYGASCLSVGLTLMSCTSYIPDGQQTFHLDPWHKLKLGWCEPRIRSLGSNGVETLWAAQMRRPDAQVVLYDPARGASEYFILEYRTSSSSSGPGYDREVAGSGLVIWQVKQGEPPPGMPGVFTLGAPTLTRGGNGVWGSGITTPYLVWTDGASTLTRLQVRAFTPGTDSITIEWQVGEDTEVPPPGGPGYALNFDGINDYLTAAPPSIPTGNSPYTIEAWIKPDSMNAGGIVAWGNYANNQVNALVVAPSGLVNYWWGNDLTAPTTNLIGGWHHVAATYNGSVRRIYLDGILAGSDTPPSPPNFAATDFRIGLANVGQYFDGQIDEVRVWKVARSQSQIVDAMHRQLWGNEVDLVAYWRLDEQAGPLAHDATGVTANTATLVNGPEWVESDILPWAPKVEGGLEAILLPTSVQMLGSGTANGSPTTMFFAWGLSTNYGNVTPPVFTTSTNPVSWREILSGLTPGAAYHARAVATNSYGASYGADFAVTLPVLPVLAIRLGVPSNGTNTVVLTWPNPSSGYYLQQTANTSDPGSGWEEVMQVPIVNGANKEVMLPVAMTSRLYRLIKP